jgi:MYXO-CTERM domain-containing protein
MTNVTAIRVSVQGIGGYDLQLDDIVMSPIPEPAAAGLVLAMAVAFPLRRRRRA